MSKLPKGTDFFGNLEKESDMIINKLFPMKIQKYENLTSNKLEILE